MAEFRLRNIDENLNNMIDVIVKEKGISKNDYLLEIINSAVNDNISDPADNKYLPIILKMGEIIDKNTLVVNELLRIINDG